MQCNCCCDSYLHICFSVHRLGDTQCWRANFYNNKVNLLYKTLNDVFVNVTYISLFPLCFLIRATLMNEPNSMLAKMFSPAGQITNSIHCIDKNLNDDVFIIRFYYY